MGEKYLKHPVHSYFADQAEMGEGGSPNSIHVVLEIESGVKKDSQMSYTGFGDNGGVVDGNGDVTDKERMCSTGENSEFALLST
jgi:hypothetical protein